LLFFRINEQGNQGCKISTTTPIVASCSTVFESLTEEIGKEAIGSLLGYLLHGGIRGWLV